jgi:hypothetical protein
MAATSSAFVVHRHLEKVNRRELLRKLWSAADGKKKVEQKLHLGTFPREGLEW